MNKKLIIVLALAFVVGVSAAAFAEVQNVKVGGSITAAALSRQNLDLLGKKSTAVAADNEFATITKIGIDAELTEEVEATVELLNERVWGENHDNTGNNVSQEEIDIEYAYVTLKEFLKGTTGIPLNLKLGRQPLKIGSGLLVGNPDGNQYDNTQLPPGAGDLSARNAFDAIVADWEISHELKVITGFAKISESHLTSGKDTDLYVIDATYNLGEDSLNTVLEGTYALSRKVKENVNNYGGRITSVPVENLNVEGEYVYQVSNAHRKKASDAVRLGATYAMPEVTWKPAVGIDYTRLSKNWDKMHESLVPADLVNLFLSNTNISIIGLTASAKPQDDVTLKLRYANLALAKKGVTSLGDAAATGATYVVDSTKKALGYEVDAGVSYDYTADVQFGLNYGLLKPGKAFDSANRKSASQVVGTMKVSF